MKRLLTYLGLLATLLAMPYHAKAANMYLRFWNGAEKVEQMNHDGGETAWHYDFYTSDDYWKNNREIYVYPRVDNKEEYKMQSWQSEAVGENKSGTEYDFYKKSDANKYDYKITLPSDIATKLYKVTVWVTNYNKNLSDPYCKVKVTWEAVDATNLTLRTDAYNWAAVRYDEYDSANNTYIWDLTSLSDFKNTSKFKLELAGKWYGNGGTIGGDPVYFTSTGGESNPDIPSTTGNNIARLEAQYDNGWKVRIVSGNAIVKHDYYWVSPQITNGEKWPAFKMVASRNRYYSGTKVIGDGKISNKYYTFTIKEDDLVRWRTKSKIEKDQTIQWYILRDDGQVVYRPASDLGPDYLPNGGNKYDDDHTISGTLDSYVSYINFWNGSSYDGADAYMTTDTDRSGSWAFKKGYAKAHTFNLNAEKGHVLYNYTTAGASDAKGYKLAGNWKAGRKVSINIDEAKPMTAYYYKKGQILDPLSDVSECDSIVYKVSVDRPAAGWGGLYLDVLPASNADWSHAIRPLITLGNNLDGRALHGAMTTASSDQSLNPETSPNYLGYTFSFNATTMTYRLEFHTSLYLVGPGVSVKEGEEGDWDISAPSTSDPRIRLKPTQETDHYRNLVYFTKGKQFRFIKNTDEATPNYKYTWYENNCKPKWESIDSDVDYYPGNETQFRNYVQYEGTGSTDSTEPTDATGKSMTFDLPSGWYYVNFYPNAGTPYYTIEHSMELRDFNEVYYRSAAGTDEQRNVLGRNGYNFLRVWSDHIAWNKPDNIDVFVVSEFNHDAEKHETTAKLTKLNENYIPANTGVILGCKLSKDNLTSGLVYDNAATLAYNNKENVNYYNTLTAELTPYSAPATSYSGDSKLIPLYNETSLQRFSEENGISYANYLFGFYRCKKYKNYDGDYNDFDLGFWLTTGKGTTYANSAFLHLTKTQAEDLGVGTDYKMSSASAPAFMLLFDESDDNVITGISDITTAKGNSVAPQGWYTLQGVRTAKPTQRGIYIYNGKKVIVND